MSGIALVVVVFFVMAALLGGAAYVVYQGKLRRAKAIERGLKMVPLLIHLPPPSNDTSAGSRDMREVMREKTAQAEVLYNLIAGTATAGFKSNFYGQRHMALELVASGGLVHFYVAVPVNLVSVIQQAILTAYPGAKLEEVEDHNIFSQQGRLSATVGGELVLKNNSAYPIATYANLERDPMEALLLTLSGLTATEGAAVQIMIRPASASWVKHATKMTTKLRRGRQQNLAFGVADLAKATVKTPSSGVPHDMAKGGTNPNLSQLELSVIEQTEDKVKHAGFEVLVRVLVSADNGGRSQQILQDMATSFALFERPGLNGFKFVPAVDVQGLVTAFIFRFFPPQMHASILNAVELATLYHLPDSQFTPTNNIKRQMSKEVDGPVTSSTSGLLFGYNEFRGTKKEIRLSVEDRRRHTYILGQTGTGKSTMLENLIVQDMLAGNGFAFIDPHGDSAEKMLSLVPKSRAEDVIYFNPADMDFPLGLNLFEFKDPLQKDFLIQESLNMLYKLYDPNGTGVIGPRFEQWYRNAALTLMADPNGATFIEIPKVFTDTEYLKQKFKYLKDPTVIDFWTKEMGQTSDYHKSEMLGYFVSKFGAFQQNEMMRNIIGQTKSAFDLRDIMDNKKILIVNLSKGQVGELNSKLLGMMLVIKIQAAAMSRANVPESDRADFSLYVDEFQNFSTDSFASILSEARKYRLNLIVGNQFIGQLSNEIRDAVFGNIGTILAHRMGPDDAEFMVKQLAPVFDTSDLMNLPNYHSAARLMIGGLPSQPFTMSDLPPVAGNNLELGVAIKQLSAAKSGVAKAVVDADVEARLSSRPSAPAPAPVGPPVAAPSPAAAPAPIPAPTPAEPAPTPVLVDEPVAPVVESAPAAVPAAPAITPTSVPQPVSMPAPVLSPPVVAPEPLQAAPAISPAPTVPNIPAAATATPPPVATSAPDVAAAAVYAAPPPIIPPEPEDEVPVAERTALGQPLPAVERPIIEQSLPATPAPSTAALLTTPPPIGAPPIGAPVIDLPAPSSTNVAKDTLSIRDITGGSRQPVPQLSNVPDVQLIPDGAAPAVQLTPELADVPLLTYDPATDPNADVPLLVAPPPSVGHVPGAAPLVDVVPGKPAYNPATDPNAGVPLTAADMQTVPSPPAVLSPVVSVPVLETPVTPEPKPAITITEPPAVAISELPTVALTPPLAAAPPPVTSTLEHVPDWSQEPEAKTELTREPAPLPQIVTPDATNASIDDELPIHFIDPSLEAVLDRPYESSTPAPTTPAVPQPALPTVPAPVIMASPVIPTPAPVTPATPPSVAPVIAPTALVAAPVPIVSQPEPVSLVQPAGLAVVPPPIGAAPVELPGASVDSTVLGAIPLPDSPAPALPQPSAPIPVIPVAPVIQPAPTPIPVVLMPETSSIPPITSPEPIPPVAGVEEKLAEVTSQPSLAPAENPLPAPIAPPAAVLPVTSSDQITDSVKPKVVDDAVVEIKPIESLEPPVAPHDEPQNLLPEHATVDNDGKPPLAPSVPTEPKPVAAGPAEPPKTALPDASSLPEPTTVNFSIVPELTKAPDTDTAKAIKEPMVQKTEPQPHVTANEIVARTEATIDDLLSGSLIRRDTDRIRLEEPEEAAPIDKPTEVVGEGRHWVGSATPETDNPSEDEDEPQPEQEPTEAAHYSSSHKVIQPLHPIVPSKQELARELAAEAAAISLAPPVVKPAPVSPAVAASAPTAGSAKPDESPKPADMPAANPTPTRPLAPAAVVVPKPEPTPAVKPPLAPTPPIEAPVAMQTKPISPVEDEQMMPEAVSLAATDVAAAREAARLATPPPSPIETSPHKPESKRGNRLHHRGRHGGKAPEVTKPEAALEAVKPVIAAEIPKPMTEVSPEPRPVPVETKPAPKSEVAPPAPAPMTGKLILPSANKAVPTAAAPLERPDKLAKGEVFVDSAGNVIIGE